MKSPIPNEVWTQHVAILAKTGKGKTVVAKGGAGALMKQRLRCGVVDPTAAWWGMRLKADGKTPAFPMVIFGGDHADIPLIPNMGAKVGALVASSDWSWIIDISKLGADDRTLFMTGFAESLFAENRRRLNLFLDECHLYMPQQKLPTKASAHMTAACNNLVSGGRSRGLNITMISQRSAKVHKDSLTQAETLITLGMIAPHDIAAAEAWVKVQGDIKTAKAMLESLPGLPVGTGWVYAPEMGMLERVKFPMIDTFDSSRAPGVGEDLRTPTELGQIDLDEIKAQLAPKRPQPPKQVGKFDGRPTILPGPQQPQRIRLTPEITPRQVEEAVRIGREVYAKALRAESERYVLESQAVVDGFLRRAMDNLTAQLQAQVRKELAKMLQKINTTKIPLGGQGSPVAALPPPGSNGSAPPARPAPRQASEPRGGDLGLSKGQRVVLSAIANRGGRGVTREQLTIVTGYKATSRKEYLRQLGGHNLIRMEGDRIYPTDAGMDAIADCLEPILTGPELRDHLLKTLPAGEAKILGVLIDFYDAEITREELRERTDYKATSLKEYLRKLGARELVVSTRSGVKASADLFS